MPMGAPVVMNCPAVPTGARPPLPSARPVSRYTGIGESANRRATVPSRASTVRTAPSCSRSGAETCTRSALIDELHNLGDAGFGANHHQYVVGMQHFGRTRRCQHLLVA